MIDVQGSEPTSPNDTLAAHWCGGGIGLIVSSSVPAVTRERRRRVVLDRGAPCTGLALIGRDPEPISRVTEDRLLADPVTILHHDLVVGVESCHLLAIKA